MTLTKKQLLWGVSILILVVIFISVTLSATITYMILNDKSRESVTDCVEVAMKEERLHTTEIANQTKKSVVNITTIYGERAVDQSIGFDGLGTGVVLTEDGYVLTNSHVVDNGQAGHIYVTLETGMAFEAKLIWQDSHLDLAVIHIDTTGLTPIPFGDSDALLIGEPVVAIGNPLGVEYSRTVTTGIVSGLNRTITLESGQVIESLIQTDASINEGNSGGPLLNDNGEMIGINTIKITNAEGLGFAIPVNSMKMITEEIIRMGTINKVELGIQGMQVDTYQKRSKMKLDSEYGIFVINVILGSSADAAGLEKGDVILSINSEKLTSQYELIATLYKYKIGEIVVLEILREGITQQVELQF